MSETTFNPVLVPIPPKEPDDLELVGEDISLLEGIMHEGTNGDLAVVTGVHAARQSVIREMVASPGSFPRRTEWGAGLSGLLFKGASVSVRDRAVSRARARLLANPRIVKVNEVSTTIEERGLKLTIRCDAVGGTIEENTVIKPPGV